MAARDWLKGISPNMREAYDRALESISAIKGMDDSTTRALLARSWSKVANDLSSDGNEPSHDEILRHVSGDMFMDALAADGDAMLVSRKLIGVEEGSDDWTSMNGDLVKFRRAEGCLKLLSNACETLRRTMVPEPATMTFRA